MATVDVLAVVLVARGIGVWLLTTATTQRGMAAIPAMLDLWTAAGLLRLSGSASWQRIAAAAALVAVRKLVIRGRRLGDATVVTTHRTRGR